MSDPQEFMQWVSDPARTTDELFMVEVILEEARGSDWPFAYTNNDFDARMERARERKMNPAYRPALHLDELQHLIERVEAVRHSSGAYGEDRPIRDLAALRFFPHLEQMNVQSSDVLDLSPLAALPKLKSLSIGEYGDLYGCQPLCFAQCGEMRALERLHLSLRHPWPDLSALANWPALIDLRYNGNLLPFEEVSILPAAQVVEARQWLRNSTMLRNLRKLAEMPKARRLVVDSVASLEGVERYPSVVNLELAGCFRDLTPLAAMENVTALTLRGEYFKDLEPLARMPKLREIKFVREWPLDLSPLADCPQLRRVEFEHCAMMRTEVAALNAGLLPEELDFKAETPRPLAPLKLFRIPKEADENIKRFHEREASYQQAREEFYQGDEAFHKAEARAFQTAMQTRFDELLGRGWGIFDDHFISLKRYPDTLRVLELADVVRQYSAQSRFPRSVQFIVEPHRDMSEDLEEIKAREAKENEPDADYLMKYYEPESVLEENEDGRRQREERYELLKREHLLALRGEAEGELLHALNEEPEAEPETEEVEEPLTTSDDDAGEGGVAVAPPPTPPPTEETESLSDQLMFYLGVYEDCVTVNSYWAERAEYHCGVPFVPFSMEELEKGKTS